MESTLGNLSRILRDKNINKKKVDYLNNIYEKSPMTGNYVIQVALNKFTDIFNDWDNAPFKKREMDPDLALFLENCFDEIPKSNGVDICFYLPNEIKDVKREEALKSGVKTYYSFYLNQVIRSLKVKYREMLQYMLTSFSLLAVSVFLNGSYGRNIMLGIVQQGFNVGGWVFLWEAISMFFFRKQNMISEISKYERFLKSSIYFKYGIENNTTV